jgi:hypothetical protein
VASVIPHILQYYSLGTVCNVQVPAYLGAKFKLPSSVFREHGILFSSEQDKVCNRDCISKGGNGDMKDNKVQ